MYQNPNEYDKMALLAIQIYEDYSLAKFPLNAITLCQMLGITLIPYSSLNEEALFLSRKLSKDGFSFKENNVFTIYYNDTDDIFLSARTEYTLLHELKHCLTNDTNNDELTEDMADYFAKYMKCPIPYLVIMNIVDIDEIATRFNVSQAVAGYVSSNVTNRIKTYGKSLFEYEVPLIRLLLGNNFKRQNYTVIKK